MQSPTPISVFGGAYAFLSNLYPAQVRLLAPAHVVPDGAVYATVEHAYQAAKTLDVAERVAIWRAPTPGAAKRLGRGSKLRADWDELRIPVMWNLLRQKFSAPTFAAQLLATGPAPLVEGNTGHDNFWGSCWCTGWGNRGENRLGRMLIELRKGAQNR